MIFMFLDIRGLGKLSKKNSLGRFFYFHEPDITMIEETMGEGNNVIDDMYKYWKDWDFLVVDSERCLGGLLTGWRKKTMNYVCLSSRIGEKPFSMDLRKVFV